jgi:hypothetical protein
MLAALAMLAIFDPTLAHANPASFFPEADDVRFQMIEKQAGERDWPFVETKGRLACVPSFGMRVVLFFPDRGDVLDAFAEPSGVIVTTDPIQLFSDVNGKAHLAPGMSIEDKIRRLGPYVSLGKKLCDQPKGTALGPSEL